ncbi:MAG: TetR family transcriptional regulator C-terminal domain-containing protein, partial [Myxococcota bacterium]
ARAGVSKGMLTYYFATKDDLVVAALEHHHARQQEQLALLAVATGLDAAAKLRLLVEAAFPSLHDVRREVRLRSEIWSYAKGRPQAAEAVQQSYRRFREACATMLRAEGALGLVRISAPERIYPVIHAIIEGLSFQVAADAGMTLDEVRDLAEAAIRRLLRP